MASADMIAADTQQPLPRIMHRRRRRSSSTAKKFRQKAAWSNFGFFELKRLQGNIGYLRVDLLHPAAIAGDTANAAMAFLANTEALTAIRHRTAECFEGGNHRVRRLCWALDHSGAKSEVKRRVRSAAGL
jgi:hypothetical protein